jgi:hypothetical protein
LIIDARGRKVWGDLSIVGNVLRITIPEQWLAEAAYPVVVDPTVGTTTVGGLSHPVENPDRGSSLVYEIAVNRFLAPAKITGQCKAWAYFSHINTNNHNYHPRLYDDNNNKPSIRRSCNEGSIFWGLWLDDNYKTLPVENTPKWKSTTFDVISTINEGSYIWFGGYGEVYYPRFDYGALLYKAYQEYIYEDDDDEEGIEYPDFPYFGYERTYDRKVSWYFEFINQSQNYIRTITQGVSLSDSRKLTAEYKRSATQTARVNSTLLRFETFYRKCEMTLLNTMSLSRFPVFSRTLTESIKATLEKKESRSISRMCIDDVEIKSENKRFLNAIRLIQDGLKGLDSQTASFVFFRYLTEDVTAMHKLNHWGVFIRGLLVMAESTADISHGANYYRFQTDMVQAEGSVFRGLLLFVKIVTGVFVRDFLLRRFLIAREELTLKSCITRDLILDSKIN